MNYRQFLADIHQMNKRQRHAFSAKFFALGALLMAVASVLEFVGGYRLIGAMFVAVALMYGSLALLQRALSRRS